MVVNNATLDTAENTVRECAESFKSVQARFREEEEKLAVAVRAYQRERERLQRDAWAKEVLGWCQRCEMFYPKESTGILYTEGREWHGGHGHESHSLYKRLRSFCTKCNEYLLSRPRGREEEFQCFKAREQDGSFEIFVLGAWQALSESERIVIEIERGYIPEGEYSFGKLIGYNAYPRFELTIGDEKII